MTNLLVQSNVAGYNGGGVLIVDTYNVTVENGSINNNLAENGNGGAIFFKDRVN